MHRSATFYNNKTPPPKPDTYARSNSLHAIKFNPSDFHSLKSPCEKDRFFSERKFTRRRLFSAPSGSENMPVELNNCISPFTEKSPKPPIPIIPRKHDAPVVVDKVLDAPDVLDEPPVKLIDFNSDNTFAVALGQSVYIWDDGNVTQLMEADSPITSICWVNNGIVISARGEVELWDPCQRSIIQPFASHGGRCGAASSIGHRIATGGSDGIVNITDIRTGAPVSYEAHHGAVSALSWSSDGIHLASCGTDSTAIVWGDQRKKTFDFRSPIYGVSWISQNVFAVGENNESGDIVVTHLRSEEEQARVSTNAPISGMCYSEKWGLIVSHRNNSADWEIWAPTDLRKVAEYGGHTGDIINLTGSHDGSFVATIGLDETVRLWEMKEKRSRTPRASMKRQSFPVGISLR